MRVIQVVLLMGLAMFSPVQAGGQYYTPEPGSAERKAIMDAVRIPVMKDLVGQRIVFVVRRLRIAEGWAYLDAVPRLKNGKKVNYQRTKFNEDIKAGVFDDWVAALLKKEGGRWVVKVHEIGATDYPGAAWPDAFGAPEVLFK